MIASVRGFVEKLLAQRCFGLGCLGYNQQPAGVLVNAMHQSHLGIIGIEALQIAQMPGHCVNQRPAEIACSRVHYHAGVFVDHHQAVVFIHYVQCNFFGQDRRIALGAVEHQTDYITRAHLIVALYRLSAYENTACIGRRLYAVTTRMLHMLGQKLVNPHRRLTGIHLHFPVFVEARSLIFGGRNDGIELLVFNFYIFKLLYHGHFLYCQGGTFSKK